MRLLDATLIEQTLKDPAFLPAFPEFSTVHTEWERTHQKKVARGGCSSCAARAARRRIASLFTTTLVNLPVERRAAVRAYYGEDLRLEGVNAASRKPMTSTVLRRA